MGSFLDNLPPDGLDDVYKLLIYLGILYFFATAFTSWLITRKRAKPVRVEDYDDDEYDDDVDVEHPLTPITFEDSKDMLASMKIEITGAEASLTKITELFSSEEISPEAYNLLTNQYNTQVTQLTEKINEMLQTSIISSKTGVIDEGISEEEMADIEADLEKQLIELEKDDDFLKPRSRKRKSPTSIEPTPTKVPAKPKVQQPPKKASPAPSPVPPKIPTPIKTPTKAPIPSKPSKKHPMPPPPTKPGAKKTVSPPMKPQPTPVERPVAIPTPPSIPRTPPPTKPKFESVSAAQPLKVQAEPEKEQIFAKSTSIAALRMDMLRELARLKKLINEDE